MWKLWNCRGGRMILVNNLEKLFRKAEAAKQRGGDKAREWSLLVLPRVTQTGDYWKYVTHLCCSRCPWAPWSRQNWLLSRPRAPQIHKISIYWKYVLHERSTVNLRETQEGTVSRCWQKVSYPSGSWIFKFKELWSSYPVGYPLLHEVWSKHIQLQVSLHAFIAKIIIYYHS